MIKLNNSGVVFDKAAHTYHLNGKKLSGVTKMIARYLDDSLADIDSLPEHIQEKIFAAGDYGSLVHDAIEDYINKGTIDRIEVYDFIAFCEENNLKPIAAEYLVTDGNDYASAIDVVCEGENGVVLVDTKTARTHQPRKIELQLSIYKRWFEELNPKLKVDKALVFRVNRRDAERVISETKEVSFVSDEVLDDMFAKDKAFHESGEIQTINDNLPTELDNLIINLTTTLQRIDKYKALEKELRKSLEEAYKSYGVEKLETDQIVISKREGYIRKGFDKKAFEKEYPDIAKIYETKTEVKPSIQIRLK